MKRKNKRKNTGYLFVSKISNKNFIDRRSYTYLNEKRIYWSRCDVNDNKQLEHVMKKIWNSPRFNIIIDNTNNYESLRKYGIGKYYKEVGNEIFCHSCQR